ncbi:hypothetical protein CBR_g9017 [Chara braunii]|uniref:Uncharacterized protein n=1 Tax=Chara braunii TaxID=69332 RepID=A0A388KNI2_CHABU|nr:hypothetical protein CBR_g9017 [Chara braunii]|eukprot:GBG71601.1 hypothetical protein CBR_g9017 [Chara braunii]
MATLLHQRQLLPGSLSMLKASPSPSRDLSRRLFFVEEKASRRKPSCHAVDIGIGIQLSPLVGTATVATPRGERGRVNGGGKHGGGAKQGRIQFAKGEMGEKGGTTGKLGTAITDRTAEQGLGVGVALHGLTVLNLQGKEIPFVDLWHERRIVIGFARHFGCLLCKKRADQLIQRKAEIEAAGASIVLIGPGTIDQANAFLQQTKFPGEIYADPSGQVFQALGFLSGPQTIFTAKALAQLITARLEGYTQDWQTSLQAETVRKGGWQQGGVLVAGPGVNRLLYLEKVLLLVDFRPWLRSLVPFGIAGGYHSRDDREGRRPRSPESGRSGNRESSMERRGDSNSRSRERRQDQATGEASQRPPPVCFGCKMIGHYRSDCWRFWTDASTRRQMEAEGHTCPTEFDRRGGVSPPRAFRQPTAVQEDPAARAQLEELGRNMASMQEFIEMERARHAERELRRQEREAARIAEEKVVAAEAERAARKVEKLRRKEEEQLAMAKAVEVQLSLRLGDIRDEIKIEVRRVVAGSVVKNLTSTQVTTIAKEKGKAVEDLPSSSGTTSEIEAITEGAENLTIQDKRKREVDTPVGDSPPVTTPAKRVSKRQVIRPVRLSERLQRTRTRISVRKSARTKAMTAMKAPARDTMVERMLYLDNTRRELSRMDCDQLRAICREEAVPYATKVQAIFDIADRRAVLQFGDLRVNQGALVNPEEAAAHSCDRRTVLEVKQHLDGLALMPLDRNPGETLVICPRLYYEGMMDLFIRNPGYVAVDESTTGILARMKTELRDQGLLEFARWDRKGAIGQAYAMPKHKDLDRFRPICPSYPEPTARTGRAMAKGLNHLLYGLSRDWHFNLKAVSQLKGTLARFNTKLQHAHHQPELIGQSFDIKDMFSQLPHQEIIDAVDWLLDYHIAKGRTFVRVNTRGKGASFGLTTGFDHWRKLDFHDIREFAVFELTHTYTLALGVLMQQKDMEAGHEPDLDAVVKACRSNDN